MSVTECQYNIQEQSKEGTNKKRCKDIRVLLTSIYMPVQSLLQESLGHLSEKPSRNGEIWITYNTCAFCLGSMYTP